MDEKQANITFRVSGVVMLAWIPINAFMFDLRFFTYLSTFWFGAIAVGLVLKLKNRFLNLLTLAYWMIVLYLLILQVVWVSQHGIYTSFTYQTLDPDPYPWWVHVIVHGVPVVWILVVMVKIKPEVNWRHFLLLVIIMFAWSYAMDFPRFTGVPEFMIGFPVGVPLTIVHLLVYSKLIRPRLMKKESLKVTKET